MHSLSAQILRRPPTNQTSSLNAHGAMIHVRSATARFVFDNSLLLLAGTLAAVVWANIDVPTYDAMAHPLHFWVNDVGMVFFFALAATEVFEATLPGGALASGRQAASPLAAAVGGMAAPAAIYTTLALTLGPTGLSRGWAIPCATDIAFSAMVARVIFPVGHPAIPFLLLLAIADDALGLVILAVFYPSGTSVVRRAHWLHDSRRCRGAMATTTTGPELLAVPDRSGSALVGGVLRERVPSCAGARSHRALDASRSA